MTPSYSKLLPNYCFEKCCLLCRSCAVRRIEYLLICIYLISVRISHAENEIESENHQPCEKCGQMPLEANPLYRAGVVSRELAEELKPPKNLKRRQRKTKFTEA